jgi:PAS domain S-box-containing protein
MSQGRFAFSDAASRAVLDAAPEGILVANREGQIVHVNAQTEELFGYGPDELLGLHFAVLLPESFREEHERQIAGYTRAPGLRPGRVGLELRGLRKDGTEVLLEMSLCSVDVQDGSLVCCVLRKIAGPKPSEHPTREVEERFRLMVENSHDILTIRDADCRVRYASPSIHRVLGYRQEEIIGSTGFELLHPEDRANVETALNEFWKNPGARDSIQYRARHANGSWVSLEVVAYNLLDHPEIRGVVINGRDISQRMQTEAERERVIAELQEAISKLDTLTGLLTICASCKKIHAENGSWQQIESYIRDRSQVEFSHTMCPECSLIWYPDHYQK